MIIMFSNVIFFFNDTATTEIYTLSLHDALPIFGPFVSDASDVLAILRRQDRALQGLIRDTGTVFEALSARDQDRKSTRLNSSHANISYAVFCLKKKKIRTFTNIL